jgi:hypothetical protein
MNNEHKNWLMVDDVNDVDRWLVLVLVFQKKFLTIQRFAFLACSSILKFEIPNSEQLKSDLSRHTCIASSCLNGSRVERSDPYTVSVDILLVHYLNGLCLFFSAPNRQTIGRNHLYLVYIIINKIYTVRLLFLFQALNYLFLKVSQR